MDVADESVHRRVEVVGSSVDRKMAGKVTGCLASWLDISMSGRVSG